MQCLFVQGFLPWLCGVCFCGLYVDGYLFLQRGLFACIRAVGCIELCVCSGLCRGVCHCLLFVEMCLCHWLLGVGVCVCVCACGLFCIEVGMGAFAASYVEGCAYKCVWMC